MITFKTLLETVYEPKSGDEKNFKDKHVVAKYKTPYDTESQFTSTATKAKRKADYDSKEDEQVYEAAELHTKRADKEAVIVRAVDPNTGQSKARVVKRGTGEIKIGEAMDPVGKHDADIDNDGDTDKSDKYLIARRKAIGKAIRKEEVELDEAKTDVYHQHMLKALGKTRLPKDHPYTSSIATNGDFVVRKGSEIAGRIPKGEHNLKEEVEQIDELSKKTLGSYAKKASKDAAGKALKYGYNNAGDNPLFMKAAKRLSGVDKAVDKMTKEEVELDEAAKTDDHWVHISHAGNFPSPTKDKIVGYSRPSKDAPKLKAGANGAMRVGLAKKKGYMVEESEQIDEISKDLKKSYLAKAKDDVADRKKTISQANKMKNASSRNFHSHSLWMDVAYKNQDKNDSRKAMMAKAKDSMKVKKEEVELDEAFKIGAMKLKDGSTVTLTRESVDAFNKLFNQLNSANKAKMEERMLSSKAGFQEILGFAENI